MRHTMTNTFSRFAALFVGSVLAAAMTAGCLAEPPDPFASPEDNHNLDTEGRLVLVSESDVVYNGEGDALAMELVDFAALAGLDWAELPEGDADALQWWFEGSDDPEALFSVAEAEDGPVLTMDEPGEEARLKQRTADFPEAARGATLVARMEARAYEADILSLLLEYHEADETHEYMEPVPGDGEWRTVEVRHELSDDEAPGHAVAGIVRHAGPAGANPPEVRRVSVWLVEPE
ncbi:MAG: hypothetical protein ACLFU6_12970 [Candidatus Hydrogenedentota bacterium]